jgi:hypothetical protein
MNIIYDEVSYNREREKEKHTQGFLSRYIVLSFSLEPATASSIPSRVSIWLSLSHKSSNL